MVGEKVWTQVRAPVMIRPVPVRRCDSVRVIADADRQHDRSSEPVVVGAVGEAAEDQVLVGEAVVDADGGGVLRRGNQRGNDQVRAEQGIDPGLIGQRRGGEEELRQLGNPGGVDHVRHAVISQRLPRIGVASPW